MGREILYNAEEVPSFTPNEPWTPERVGSHFYNAQGDFAIERLKGSGCCLVIGSPIFEAKELAKRYSVTYLDIRELPQEHRESLWFINADATNIPLPDSSFDAVSSTCVLCHAGMGRYGDPIVEDGDLKMLAEIARVLKHGSPAALTFGPVWDEEEFVKVGTMQRVYNLKEAFRMAEETGLEVVEYKVYGLREGWVDHIPPHNTLGLYYLSMLVRK